MSSIDEYFRPTMILCNIIGMWPVDVKCISLSKRGFYSFRKFIALLAIGNLIVPEIIAIVENKGDLVVITRVGCVLKAVSILAFKMIYLILNGSELARIYFTVRNFFEAMKPSGERKVYEKFARWAKVATIISFTAGFGINITFTTAVIIDWVRQSYSTTEEARSPRRLPFEVRYGFDIESTPNYEITFFCQTVSGFLCCVGIAGLDSIMMTLALHVSAQFAVLKFWYSDIGKRVTKERELIKPSETISFPPFLHEDITRCLGHHQKIIELADQLEALLNPVIFAQLVTSATEICLSGYAITTGIDNVMDMVRFTNCLIAGSVQLFGWCMVGEILKEESEGVGEAVFHDIPWYWFPVYIQGDLKLVIRRSQKSCLLTAAKFQIMNIETLGDVLTTAASYFTVLRQMKKEE